MDPLRVLGLKLGASQEEVRRAYRKAALRTHPDRGGSHEAFVEVGDAYRALTAKERPVQAGSSAPRPPPRAPAPPRQTAPKERPWESTPGPAPRPSPRPTSTSLGRAFDHEQILRDVLEAEPPMRQDSFGQPFHY